MRTQEINSTQCKPNHIILLTIIIVKAIKISSVVVHRPCSSNHSEISRNVSNPTVFAYSHPERDFRQESVEVHDVSCLCIYQNKNKRVQCIVVRSGSLTPHYKESLKGCQFDKLWERKCFDGFITQSLLLNCNCTRP